MFEINKTELKKRNTRSNQAITFLLTVRETDSRLHTVCGGNILISFRTLVNAEISKIVHYDLIPNPKLSFLGIFGGGLNNLSRMSVC